MQTASYVRGLELVNPTVSFKDIGGMKNLKDWVAGRKYIKAHQEEARKYGVTSIGVIFAGLPGTGKTVVAGAIANEWGVPFYRLNLSELLFSEIFGKTEHDFQHALDTISNVGPCVVLIDAVEKVFCNLPGQTNEKARRDLGTLLIWMNKSNPASLNYANKATGAFLVFTVNDVNALPPEFIRAGRTDALFFFDLPSATERTEIIKLNLDHYGMVISDIDRLVVLSENLVPAEIESWCKEALVHSYKCTSSVRQPFSSVISRVTLEDFETTVGLIVPVMKYIDINVKDFRDWARTRMARPAYNSIR